MMTPGPHQNDDPGAILALKGPASDALDDQMLLQCIW